MEDFSSESEQWDAVKRWLRENGLWIVGGIALGVAALAGWRLWEERRERIALEASASYEQAIEALSRNDRTRALTLFDQLRTDHGRSPYADQGDLLAARLHVEAREFDKAAARLRGVMDGSPDKELRAVARGRLARLLLEQGKADEALALLPADTKSAFAPRYAEIRGDALLAKGDQAGALAAYRSAREAAEEGVVDRGLIELKIGALETKAP